MTSDSPSTCSHCGYQPSGERDAYLHRMNKHVRVGSEVGDESEAMTESGTKDAAIGFAGLALVGLVLFLIASSMFRACSNVFDSSPGAAPRQSTVQEQRSPDTAFEDAWSTLSRDEQFSECFRFVIDEDAWISSFIDSSSNPTPSDAFIRSFLRRTCPSVIQ